MPRITQKIEECVRNVEAESRHIKEGLRHLAETDEQMYDDNRDYVIKKLGREFVKAIGE